MSIHACKSAPLVLSSTPHFAVSHFPSPLHQTTPGHSIPSDLLPTQSYHRSRSSLSRLLTPPPSSSLLYLRSTYSSTYHIPYESLPLPPHPEAVFVVTFLLLPFFRLNPIQPDVNPTTPLHVHIHSPSKKTRCVEWASLKRWNETILS